VQYTKYGPKGQYSPTVGDACGLCGKPLAAGDYTTLVRRADDGRFADNGIEVHWACAVPDDTAIDAA
jgi:hypothetical protein